MDLSLLSDSLTVRIDVEQAVCVSSEGDLDRAAPQRRTRLTCAIVGVGEGRRQRSRELIDGD